MIRYATDENFRELIKTGPAIVDFFGEFCVPCKMIGSILEDLDVEYPFLNIIKVDTDECEALTEEFKIDGIPDLYFFRDGQVVHREMGAIGEDELKEHISDLLYSGIRP